MHPLDKLHRFHRATQVVDAAFDIALSSGGEQRLTPRKATVLVAIHRTAPTRQIDLVGATGINRLTLAVKI